MIPNDYNLGTYWLIAFIWRVTFIQRDIMLIFVKEKLFNRREK